MRRKPLKVLSLILQDYDLTLLVTNEVLDKYNRDFIIELIISLVGTLEKDLLEIKLNITTQCRIAASYLIGQMANTVEEEFY